VPVDADDARIAQAVATGDRVHAVLYTSMMEQVASLRAGALGAAQQPAWATAKQLGYLARLREELGVDTEEWEQLCERAHVPTDENQMTRSQASTVIDALQALQGQRRLTSRATNGYAAPDAGDTGDAEAPDDIPF